jgi:hypothetical protein
VTLLILEVGRVKDFVFIHRRWFCNSNSQSKSRKSNS